MDQVSKKSYVRFIKGISTEVEPGYQIPEAFTWGDNNEIQLKGYWMSKYQLSIEETKPKIEAEITAGSSVIRIKEIKGSNITENLKYEYYLNGDKKHEGDSSTEKYAYTGLEPKKEYTVNIIAKKADGTEVGAITKKISTIEANKPELIGFSEENTYYVLYDKDGNRTIGNKIKNDGSNIPKEWYDYSQSKWANIVTTDGKVENGEIKEATNTSYFVWIPRYEYRILTDRTNISTENKRTEVNFIQGTDNENTKGYQIPEAFYWGDDQTNYKNNKPITGYWISKYQLSN